MMRPPCPPPRAAPSRGTARAWLLSLALCAPSAAALAQEPDPGEEGTPAEQLEELQDEFRQAQQRFFERLGRATTDEERERVFTEHRPDDAAFAARFLALSERYPDDPVAVKALAWVVGQVGGQAKASTMNTALTALLDRHADSAELASVCEQLGYETSPTVEHFLRRCLEHSPHAPVRGQACYSLAGLLGQRVELAQVIADDPSQTAELEESLGSETMDLLVGADPETLRREREALLERATKEFGDVPHWRGTLADAARGDLFELRHLQVGMVAPDIEGEDVDGVRFRLSDYRGKVIFLDFWGHW